MTRDKLLMELQQGRHPKWLFFWGHTPSKNGALSNTCFSQWWAGHPFIIDHVRYATAEHFMMAEKARLFGDSKTLARILESNSPAIAKKLGREVENFQERLWLKARWEIVVRGNLAKFSQHPDLRMLLTQTKDSIIVEASPYDRIWGIGMAATDRNAENPAQWNGLNLLGFSLMEVRSALTSQTSE